MFRSGNKLLIVFLVCSFVFFVVAVIVEEFALFDSDVEVQRDDTSGGTYGEDVNTDDPASASSSTLGDDPRQSSRQLRLVSTTWPPFANVTGKPRFALDVVGTALQRMGIDIQTIITDEDRLSSVLVSGGFEGSAAAWRNPDHERTMIYSQPYLENRLILVGRQGGDVSATSLAALAGSRVALVAGYAYTDVVETADGPLFVRSNSDEDSVTRLLNGEVDFILMDDLVVQYLIGNHGEEARTRLAFGATPLLSRTLHLAVRRTLPDADTIISRFNAELRAMIADRTYHRLLILDWIRADVDGDGLMEYIPYNDRTGPVPPMHAYELFSPGGSDSDSDTAERFYLDGAIYEDWSAVPEQYKVQDIVRSDPNPRTAESFNFTW